MLKRLMISTAAVALVVGSAVAQQAPPSGQSSPPAMQKKDMPPTAKSSAAGAMQFVTQQTADQWLASKFRGTDVIGNNKEKIGDVTDILFDRTGKIIAYVIGVGGFLGIGAKDVALTPDAFQVEMDKQEVKLKLAMTREELKNAPDFKARSAQPAPTTGQAPPRAPTSPAPR
jgi:hypothetical protein